MVTFLVLVGCNWFHPNGIVHAQNTDDSTSGSSSSNVLGVVQPIEANANVADCSAYTHSIQIDDYVYMEYVLTEETFSAYMTFNTLAWVAFGVAKNSNGYMSGSDAIIGLPNEQISSTNPGKYIMDGYTSSSVYLRDDSKQNLMNANVWQDTSSTYLQFTKYNDEGYSSDEHYIYTNSTERRYNYFIWAYGYDNTLALHNTNTGCGSFRIPTRTLCIPEPTTTSTDDTTTTSTNDDTTNNDPSDTMNDTSNTTDSTTTTSGTSDSSSSSSSSSLTIKKNTTSTTTTDSDSGTLENDGGKDTTTSTTSNTKKNTTTSTTTTTATPSNGTDSCTSLIGPIDLQKDGTLHFYYQVYSNNTITIKLVFGGEAWISIGIAPNKKGTMIGSDAIIGLPDEPNQSPSNPGYYYMSSTDISGVQLMDTTTTSSEPILLDASITQDSGTTTLEFTRKLQSASKTIPIDANGQDIVTFLWAYGFSNELALHKKEGSFSLTLVPCTEQSANGSSGNSAASPITSSSLQERYSTNRQRTMWFTHAILGVLGWGFLAPTAYLSSKLRVLVSPSNIWLKVHFYLNIIVGIFTLCLFGIAVVLYQSDGSAHFKGTHEAVGLTIFLFTIVQIIGGITRPPKPDTTKLSQLYEKQSKKTPTSSVNGDVADIRNDNYNRNIDENDDDDDEDNNGQLEINDKEYEIIDTSDHKRTTAMKDVPKETVIDDDEEPTNNKIDNTRQSVIRRTVWEVLHKYIGCTLVLLGLWQVQNGIELYTTKFGITTNYIQAYWSVLGISIILIISITLYTQIRSI